MGLDNASCVLSITVYSRIKKYFVVCLRTIRCGIREMWQTSGSIGLCAGRCIPGKATAAANCCGGLLSGVAKDTRPIGVGQSEVVGSPGGARASHRNGVVCLGCFTPDTPSHLARAGCVCRVGQARRANDTEVGAEESGRFDRVALGGRACVEVGDGSFVWGRWVSSPSGYGPKARNTGASSVGSSGSDSRCAGQSGLVAAGDFDTITTPDTYAGRCDRR